MQNSSSNLLKLVAASVLLAASFNANTIFAQKIEDNGLETIYHLYNSGAYIGAVSDEEKVETLVDEKITETNAEFEELNLQASDEFTMIAEQVFEPAIDDENAAIDKLDEELSIKASTFALAIDGKAVVQLKDRAAYDETIRLLKLAYVTPEELEELEKNEQSDDSLPELKEGQTRITDISIEEKISGMTRQADPDQVMPAEKAADFLLKEKGLTVTVQKEEKVAEGVKYKTVEKEDKHLFTGKSKVEQEGKEGKKELVYAINEKDGKQVERSEIAEKIIEEPTEKVVLNGTKKLPEIGSGEFAWPAEGGYISSEKGPRWGRQHKGIDIAQPDGFDIKAADHGIVKAAGADGTFGNRVIIDHQNGYETIYAHLDSIDVKAGQKISRGTKLGVMGTTGRSTGVHLHFEISLNGATKNPLNFVKQ